MEIDLRVGDSLIVLKELEDNSVDSVVTDPPYGLKFMSKKWDYDVPTTELWKEVIRVLKPGGHLLSFSSARTYHRMAVAVEDAGFEIRDQIMWVYGSGFPKSHNIGKSYDKKMGNEREVVGDNPNTRPNSAGDDNQTHEYGHTGAAKLTKGTSPYEGWGTALKPAHEPIVLARKPFKGTVVDNVIKYGTGGINIDKSRVVHTDDVDLHTMKGQSKSKAMPSGGTDEEATVKLYKDEGRFPANFIHDGSDEVVEHFPDTKGKVGIQNNGCVEYKDGDWSGRGETRKSSMTGGTSDNGSAARFFYCAKVSKSERNAGLDDSFTGNHQDWVKRDWGTDICNTCGKSAKDRGSGICSCETPDWRKQQHIPNKNNHPTVKPVKLMSYLVNLITPVGGTVLDPFVGSGSTGMACKANGYNFIGIDLDEEYINITKTRIDEYNK